MPDIGMKEIIIIAVIFILLFGTKKIPELAKSLVEAVNHLKSAFRNGDSDSNKITDSRKR